MSSRWNHHFLHNTKGLFTRETARGDAGGGPSQFESRPTYQNVIQSIVGRQRGTPDISSEAWNVSYVAIYSQYGCGRWCGVGGTSVSSPTLTRIVNAAGTLNTSTDAELTEAYGEYGVKKEYKADFTDITTGSNGYACEVGWDFCTGIGVPQTYKGKVNPVPLVRLQLDLDFPLRTVPSGNGPFPSHPSFACPGVRPLVFLPGPWFERIEHRISELTPPESC
ncbi:MAG: hypothetical protein ABSD75_28105 [Terriglobales bacterium]|jgi:hypothetical protein